MSCIRTEDHTDWTADLVAVRAQITAINAALADDTVLSGTREYSFDSGTGIQREKFSSPQDLIQTLSTLLARRDRLKRLLRGNGLLRGAMRR
ncbi:MAG: hypothetical protein DRP56_04245 [Planctomycetota bacterium]|nr:MAG: hypothetical protein DRP56_04245 [Planctomycetota bacterium]